MKTQTKRLLILLFIAILTATAAVMVVITTTGAAYDAEIAAESLQDAQLNALAAENVASLSPTFTIDDWTYGTPTEQTPLPELLGNSGGGNVTYIYKGTPNSEEADSFSSENIRPTEAGKYKLSVKIAATDNTYTYKTPEGG